MDARAEACLLSADRLVSALEAAGFGGEPHIVNVSGRTRVLGQRLAKHALLAALGVPDAAEAVASAQPPVLPTQETVAQFDRALVILHAAPLGDPELHKRLAQGSEAWARLQRATVAVGSAAGRSALASASQEVLAAFEELTTRYERSLDLLIG